MATAPSSEPPPYLINFDAFKPVYAAIHLPKNVLLLRGYDTRYDPVSDYAAYYTHDAAVARGYAAYDHHALGVFRTTRPIKLYDLRFIKVLLREYIQQLRGARTKSVLEAIHVCTLSLGLYSYETQLRLFEQRYPAAATDAADDPFSAVRERLRDYQRRPPPYANPIELTGVRIGETYNDRQMLQFLKELFGREIDGYVAPKFRSPFHVEKDGVMNAELVLFNPRECGIERVTGLAAGADGIAYQPHDINYFLDGTGLYTMKTFGTCTLRTAVSPRRRSGGADRQTVALYDPNSLLDKGDSDPENRKVVRRAQRMAAAWRKALPAAYFAPIPRAPTVRPAPWHISSATDECSMRAADAADAADY